MVVHSSGAPRREIAEAYAVVPHHCERSEAIHSFFVLRDGLLRFARNDGENWLFEN